MNEKLRSLFIRMGTPTLVQLYGEENVDAIAGIMNDSVTSSRLVELLDNKFGRQILAQRDIRRSIFGALNHSQLGFILDGKNIPNRSLTAEDASRLYKMQWGRTRASSKRLIELLELNENYLPPSPEVLPSMEIINPEVYLYEHQSRLKDLFVRKLISGDERILLHMPTGAGKTRTSIEGVVDYWKSAGDRSKNIIWLAHSEELCEQAVETFKFIWGERGDKEVKLFRLWGSHTLEELPSEGAIIVAGFQKLYSMISSKRDHVFKLMASLKQASSVVVVDEAHKAIAPTYQTCIEYLSSPTSKLIGLTATPGRSTDDVFNIKGSETEKLAEFFNFNKLGLTNSKGIEIQDPIGYLQELGFLSRIVRKKVTTDIQVELSSVEQRFIAQFLEIPASVLNQLAINDERNALILGEISSLHIQRKQIIVFALSVKHARTLNDLLNLRGINSRCVDGETSSSERVNAITSYKSGNIHVLINYGVLTTGFDAPNTNAIVITRPTASLVLYSQMIGRGIRGTKVGGNAECTLVDIEDNLIGFPSEQQAFTHFDTAWGI